MKNAPAQKQKSRKHTKLKLVLLFLAIAIVAGAAWHGIARIQHHHAVDQQRAQFAQAEKDLDTLTQSIVTKFGQPEQNIKTKNCDYTSPFNEFAKHGDLVCNVSRSIVYPVTGITQTVSLSKQIAVVASQAFDDMHNYWQDKGDLSDQTPLLIGSTESGDIDRSTLVTCGASYTEYAPRDVATHHYPSSQNSLNLLVSLDCSARPTLYLAYPLVKQPL